MDLRYVHSRYILIGLYIDDESFASSYKDIAYSESRQPGRGTRAPFEKLFDLKDALHYRPICF
jgi:hypothetical protein